MPPVGDLVTFALPALAVVVLGALAAALLAAVLRLVRRLSGSGRAGETRPEPTLRRCESCGNRWRGLPGQQPGVLLLRVRRRVRRRRRARRESVPAWAKAQGWRRCPSCLSTRVRTSGEPSLDPARRRDLVQAAAVSAIVVGACLLAFAGLRVAMSA